MQGLGETLAELARALRETPLEAAQAPRLRAILRHLHRFPPGRERDGLLAVVYLRLFQLFGQEEDYFRGYSYARTARLEAVRLLSERVGERG